MNTPYDTSQSEQGIAPALVLERMLQAGQLGFQRCITCEASIFPPRVLCPRCGGTDLQWKESAGYGVVYSSTTVYERGQDPYNVAVVDVAEGFRLMTRIEGLPPEDVAIGLGVRLKVRPANDDQRPLVIGEALAENP